MKKLLSAILISSLILSFAACSGKDSAEDSSQKAEETVEASEAAEETAEEAAEAAEEGVEISEGEDIVIDVPVDETKTVYWATADKDPSDVCYHKEDCAVIKDKSPDVLSWEIIKALGMPPCEECKPLD